ncbi:MAG: hypothetical protein ACOX85_05215, partial [Candidatus Pararuminococcus gallinarum]
YPNNTAPSPAHLDDNACSTVPIILHEQTAKSNEKSVNISFPAMSGIKKKKTTMNVLRQK